MDKKNNSFTLFTEVPKFDLFKGEEDLTRTSMLQWEPPSSLEDVQHAIDELNGDNPASIMLETADFSLSVLGGPERFACIMSDGTHAYHFISKAREAATQADLKTRIHGTFGQLSAKYALSKDEAVFLAVELARGNNIIEQKGFEIEIKKIEDIHLKS